MSRKGRYKAWIALDEALFHLSFTTGKTKLQNISRKEHCKDAAVLQNASWPSGIIAHTKGFMRSNLIDFNDLAGRSGVAAGYLRKMCKAVFSDLYSNHFIKG
ncbi:hypothetical protein TNCV_636041 [Trichonephila clavipes]|nr:hypothetical protein TNCV_636041 [Trichonephila clavipes]